MTDRTPTPAPANRLLWPIIIIGLLLIGGLIVLAYAWNQAEQAALQSDLALATASAKLAEAEQSQAAIESSLNVAAATAQADISAAKSTAQAEIAAAQAEAQAEVANVQATSQAVQATATAMAATAQARQADELAAAANQAEAQARQAQSYQLAAAALANLTDDPKQGLILASEAVSTSLAGGQEVDPQLTETLRQAVWANRLGNPITAGHTGPVNDAAFSPDGNRLATAGDDGTLRIWNAISGGELLTLTHSAARRPVYSVAFSLDGSRLASASFDHTAKIWDAKTGQELLTLTGHLDWVVGVAFGPTAKQNNPALIATGSQDGTAIIWDAATGQLLQTLAPSSSATAEKSAAINRLAFNPQGNRLATASDDGAITLWDTTSGRAVRTLTGHTGPVYDVAFNPQGDRLASASLDGTIKIWESDSGREVRTLPHSRTAWATSVAFNSTGTWLASAGADGRVIIWDAVTGQQRLSVIGDGVISGVAIAVPGNGGERLATASADGQVRLWQIDNNEVVPALPPLANQQGPIYGVTINRAGSQLATSGSDGTVKIWQIGLGQSRLVRTLIPTTTAGALYAVTFSPDGKSLATAGQDSVVTIWRTTAPVSTQGGSDAQLQLTGHTGPVYALAFNPASDRLASAGEDGLVRVWDAATGEVVTELSPPEESAGSNAALYTAVFHPDGNFLAAAGQNGLVRIWDITSGEEYASLPGTGVPVRALVFYREADADSTGPLLAIGADDGSVRLWRVRQSVRALPGATAAVQALALSQDQNRLAATAADGTVTVWSLVSGQVQWRLPSPPEIKAGYGLVFLPDGNLITGSQSAAVGAALRWHVADDELLNLYSPVALKSMALSSNRLAAIGADKQIRLWQIEPGHSRWSAALSGNKGGTAGIFPVEERVVLTSLNTAGEHLVSGDDTGSVRLWAIESGKLLDTLAAHTGPVNSLLLSNNRLITAGQDNTAKVWQVSLAGTIGRQPQLTLRGHQGDIVGLALSSTGLLATASHDGTARLWNLTDSGKELFTLTGHHGWLNDLAFNAKGNLLATTGEDGTLRVWDTALGQEVLRLDAMAGLPGPIKRVAFGPAASGNSERLAALTGAGEVIVWLLTPGQNSGKPVLRLTVPGQPIGLAFDSTGRALITAGEDGVIRFYAVETEDLLTLR